MVRVLLLMLGVVVVAAACDDSEGTSFVSMEMVSYQASCEGRIAQPEKYMKEFKQSSKFAEASKERQEAMALLSAAVVAARQKMQLMVGSGSSWDDHKEEIDQALAAAETAFTKAKAAQ